MIRNETTGPDGTVLSAEIIDLDAATITVEDGQGNVVEPERALTADEVARYTPPPMSPEERIAELEAVIAALLEAP